MPRPQVLAIAAISFGLFAASAPEAYACKCKRVSRTAAYDEASVIFYGEIVEDGAEPTLKVKKSWKGTKKGRKITISKGLGKCDFPFEADQKYLVFAERKGKKKKRKHLVDRCMGTRAMDFQPITPIVWTLADDETYAAATKSARSYEARREKLRNAAKTKIRKAADKCDAGVWKAKKESVTAKMTVRFDVNNDGTYDSSVVTYQVTKAGKTSGASDDLKACLGERLAGKKFKKFSGGPVSVEATYLFDRIDRDMFRRRTQAEVNLFEPTAEKGG